MADYTKIIPFSLKYEGKEYTDIPADKGGATKWGVSELLMYDKKTNIFDVNGDGKFSKEDIKGMTLERASEIFKLYFWDKYGLDDVTDNKCAFCIFDAAINNGPKNMTKFLQKTCNVLGSNLVEDGAFGNLTKKAMLEVTSKNPEKFVELFQEYRKAFFLRIVNNNPSQKIFLNGWLNRLKLMTEDMKKM